MSLVARWGGHKLARAFGRPTYKSRRGAAPPPNPPCSRPFAGVPTMCPRWYGAACRAEKILVPFTVGMPPNRPYWRGVPTPGPLTPGLWSRKLGLGLGLLKTTKMVNFQSSYGHLVRSLVILEVILLMTCDFFNDNLVEQIESCWVCQWTQKSVDFQRSYGHLVRSLVIFGVIFLMTCEFFNGKLVDQLDNRVYEC